MRNKIFIFLIFFFLISFNLVSVSSFEYSEVENESILNCMDNVEVIISNFVDEGFNVLRLEDLSLVIKSSYVAGMGFDSIMSKCDEVEKINILAYDSRDFIGALKLFYEETDKSDLNMSSVDLMIKQIDLEFENERYEKIEDLVDATYDEIIEIQSTSSSLKVFYQSTRNGIIFFFEKFYLEILILFFSFFLFYLIFKKRIKIIILHSKIKDRRIRKEIIYGLIKDTQKEYFNGGKISEGMYKIRLKKFSELIRELDKEILGFNEMLLNLEVKKN